MGVIDCQTVSLCQSFDLFFEIEGIIMAQAKGEELKAKGNSFFSQGQYEEAIVWYTKAIEAYPQGHVYFSNRCACYTSLNQLEKALKDANECVRLKPDWAKGYYRLGHALALSHKYEEAQTALKKGSQVDPSNADIVNRLKQVEGLIKAEKAKRAKMAHSNLSPAMQAKHEGNALYKDGKFPEAIEVYTRAYNLATNDEERVALLNNRAACRFQNRDFRQCIADCSEALSLDEKNVKALLRRGLAYENIEKIDQAMTDMKNLQQISPGLPQVSQAIHRLNRMAKMK